MTKISTRFALLMAAAAVPGQTGYKAPRAADGFPARRGENARESAGARIATDIEREVT